MKKILFMMMFALVTASSFAQEKHPYYCTISGTYNLAMKIRLELEWGEQKQLVALRNEEGKKIEFNNLTDILNYMSARGWQFVTELNYDGHIHYLLKKDVSSPEEAKQGLRFGYRQIAMQIAAYPLADRRLFYKKLTTKNIKNLI